MPIYAYRCSTCGHTQDVLQKLSDAPLTVCPACGASTFAKQVTAAGFQLKGSGWYVTDFRDNGKGNKPAAEAKGGEPAAAPEASGASQTPSSPSPAPASSPAAAPAPAPSQHRSPAASPPATGTST